MKQITLLFIFTVFIISCNKDIDSSADLTKTIVGEYIGNYTTYITGSQNTSDNIEATIIKDSDNQIRITIYGGIPGLPILNMVGEMTSDTTFTGSTVSFDNNNSSGSGKIENGINLTIELENTDANKRETYIAVKK